MSTNVKLKRQHLASQQPLRQRGSLETLDYRRHSREYNQVEPGSLMQREPRLSMWTAVVVVGAAIAAAAEASAFDVELVVALDVGHTALAVAGHLAALVVVVDLAAAAAAAAGL